MMAQEKKIVEKVSREKFDGSSVASICSATSSGERSWSGWL
jgi:hypothetical protein